MSSAIVSFSRTENAVVMELTVDGCFIIRTSSHESIVRELQINNAHRLAIDDNYIIECPTSSKALNIAMEVPFKEPMAALQLIAACASIEEGRLFSKPERRAIPRPEKSQHSMVF